MIPASEIEYWASLGNLPRVQQAILSRHNVNLKSENGYTALHAAAENGHLDVIRLLIEQGALIHARLDSGETPLELAKMAGQLDPVQLLSSRIAGSSNA